MTMHMVIEGTSRNFGAPKRKGTTMSAQAALATFSKCMTPSTVASTAPAMMPSRTATLEMKPLPHLSSARITSRTNSAMPSPCSWP
jgi:hypothetical protein